MVVHDSPALYDGYPDARHQFCGAHLVRELTAAAEDHPDQRRPVQVRWTLAELNEQAKKAAEQGLADTCGTGAGLPAGLPPGCGRRAVAAPACPGPQTEPDPQPAGAPARPQRRRAALPDLPGLVPFANNTGERALRPVKTQV